MNETKSLRILIAAISFLLLTHNPVEWGFYGHRLINRMAVFTLPLDLLILYKVNIAFISDRAVDPDKRRYAVQIEGLRHYMDMDGRKEGRSLTHDLAIDVFNHARFTASKSGFCENIVMWPIDSMERHCDSKLLDTLLDMVTVDLWDFISNGSMVVSAKNQHCHCIETEYSDSIIEWTLIDSFSHHGILPYHLVMHQTWLESAFRNRDFERAMRLSAELGHYIADAHVPLHTTRNYDGQRTGQKGIHAFWESRLPELFAEKSYDFVVDPSEIIENIDSFYWQIVSDSHKLVDQVLISDLQVSTEMPSDGRWCFEERNQRVQQLECPDYALRFQEKLNGMVERQMRKAIWAIGSAWYTAWHNAGCPPVINITPSSDSFHRDGLTLSDTLFSINNHRFVRSHE